MSDMSPRKSLSSGAGMPSSGDFGVGPMFGGHDHIAGEKPSGKMLSESERGVGKPVSHTPGKYPSQSNPDHGPHGRVGRGSGM